MTSYDELRAARPELFANVPEGIDILFDPEDIEAAKRSVGAEDEPVGVVYSDRFVTVVRDAVRFPGGFLGLYLRVVQTAPNPGAVILPLLETGEIVLVEHFRHSTRTWHWEVPRGMGDPGASGAATAAREMDEELDTRVDELIPLGKLHADSGLLAHHVELYAARIKSTGMFEIAEGIRGTRTVSWAVLDEMIASGEITDAFTIAVRTRARLASLAEDRTGTAPVARCGEGTA